MEGGPKFEKRAPRIFCKRKIGLTAAPIRNRPVFLRAGRKRAEAGNQVLPVMAQPQRGQSEEFVAQLVPQFEQVEQPQEF